MKLRVLDLFCCQGGASMGYHRAGFAVYGIDINPQARYPFPFHQGNALSVMRRLLLGEAILFAHSDGEVERLTLSDFAVIVASPPCQRYTKAQKIRGNQHPDLIAPVRELLIESGKSYVIENVAEALPELRDPVMLCGAMFDLGTYRHRLFESNVAVTVPAHPKHVARTTKMGRAPVEGEFMHIVGNFSGVEQARQVMGMPWANRDGLREAIPPAYTEFIGGQLISMNIDELELVA